MDIIQQNLFCLIRSGVFNHDVQLEPMSAFKWNKLYQLAMMHDVPLQVYKGILKCQKQFFFQMTAQQQQLWEKTAKEYHERAEMLDDDFLRADHLTNPVLNHQLQNILDDENSDIYTRQLLLKIISIARHTLNEGLPVRLIIDLGVYLQENTHRTDFMMLQSWLKKLRFEQMAQLEGTMLVMMFGFRKDEIPFLQGDIDQKAEQVAQELIDFSNMRIQNFYFSQDSESIFVHTSNSSALISHLKRSARYFRYLPSEITTNFFASFAHSLSHIEE